MCYTWSGFFVFMSGWNDETVDTPPNIEQNHSAIKAEQVYTLIYIEQYINWNLFILWYWRLQPNVTKKIFQFFGFSGDV